MKTNTENLDRVKLALQLSFIFWVTLCILIFYASFGEQSRTIGTFLLLFSVILFTPFLPDGTDLPEVSDHTEIGNMDVYKEDTFEKK